MENTMEEKFEELTLGDIFDEISEHLTQARTRALLGERKDALGLLHRAKLEYTRFREVLTDYPGHHALDYAFQVTMSVLCEEQAEEELDAEAEVKEGRHVRSKRTAQKADRAA